MVHLLVVEVLLLEVLLLEVLVLGGKTQTSRSLVRGGGTRHVVVVVVVSRSRHVKRVCG